MTMRPVGLDYAAVLALAAAGPAIDTALLAELLPALESAIINPKDYEEADAW